MSILDSIRTQVKNAGSNKGKFVYFKSDVKHRIRFLTEFDEGMEVKFHDSFEKKINTPCLELFGEDCPYCEDDELRTRNLYAWSVWDYDTNSVKVLMCAVNNCSPVPSLMGFYDEYGTILDRDYTLKKTGSGTGTSFSVVPCDKVAFTNKKAKPYSDSALKSVIKKAYVDSDDEDEDEEYSSKSKKKKKSNISSDDDFDWSTGEEDYSDMSAKELYKLCKKKGIDVEPKMKEKYYITKLKQASKAKDEWEDEDDEDEDDE